MLIVRQMCRNAAGVTVLVLVAAGLGLWIRMPAHGTTTRTIPTGASFSMSVARSRSEPHARAIAERLAAVGLPAFTRSLRNGEWHQAGAPIARLRDGVEVVVGPYVTIDEAEGVQAVLAAHGFGARMVVDESVRRVPGHDGVPSVSAAANVVLVAAAGRLSVVIEMPAEPRQVLTRQVGATLLEVDVGPVTPRVDRQQWIAPAGVDLLQQVSIEEVTAARDRFLRTRMSIAESSRSNVRVIGRRVYVDLWSGESLPRKIALERPLLARAVRGEEPAPTLEVQDYREVIGPAMARLETIEPFLLAAVRSPQPDVLAALAGTLGGLDAWIRTIEPPREWADVHTSVIDAVGLAISAVDPAFHGDRTAQAHEAFDVIRAIRHQRLSL